MERKFVCFGILLLLLLSSDAIGQRLDELRENTDDSVQHFQDLADTVGMTAEELEEFWFERQMAELTNELVAVGVDAEELVQRINKIREARKEWLRRRAAAEVVEVPEDVRRHLPPGMHALEDRTTLHRVTDRLIHRVDPPRQPQSRTIRLSDRARVIMAGPPRSQVHLTREELLRRQAAIEERRRREDEERRREEERARRETEARLASEAEAKTRTWVSADGRFQTRATFLSLAFEDVKLEKMDGQEITVQLQQLSPECQDFIKERRWRD